jgi:DNA-binding NtrC family response regulator
MTTSARILIVDDDPAIRKLLAGTLAKAGYTVKTAGSGDDAIAQCASEPFDQVLSDVVMPKMNGHQLARWIAEYRPGTRMALMSGWDPGCQQCAHSPRCRVIAKPFDCRQILSFVANVLAESGETR